VPDIRPYLPLMWLALLMVLLQFIGPESLRYDARAIAAGEPWRLITGHLVHANWRHLSLNLAGLFLCQGLTGIDWRLWQWGWRILLLAAAISFGFWLWQPALRWYVGFSGVLFGLYLLAAVDRFDRQRLVSSLLIAMLVVKILIEQLGSVKIDSSEWIGVPVLVDAHLYGFGVGLLLLLLRGSGRYLRISDDT